MRRSCFCEYVCVLRTVCVCVSELRARIPHAYAGACTVLLANPISCNPTIHLKDCLRCVADACCWAWTSASPSAVARTYARTRLRSRPWQPSRTATATKNRVVHWRCRRCSITPAPRILIIWLESQPRAAAMGKDRKKVGNAYVLTCICTSVCVCMHLCMCIFMYVQIYTDICSKI